MGYAFVAPKELKAARLPATSLAIANPMSEERSVLRTGLLPGLAGNLRSAQRNQFERFAQFEVSRIFESGEELLPQEEYELGLCLWGERGLWFQEGEVMDFYDLKGAVMALLAHLGASEVTTVADDDGGLEAVAPYLHPKRRACLKVGNTAVGSLGEPHPQVVQAPC